MSESLKSRVLAECERLNGLISNHPFVVRQILPHEGAFDFETPDVSYNFFRVWKELDADDPRWVMASRLLCLPEEGKQQPALDVLDLVSMGKTYIKQSGDKTLLMAKVKVKPGAFVLSTDGEIYQVNQSTCIYYDEVVVGELPSPTMGMVKAKPIEWKRGADVWFGDCRGEGKKDPNYTINWLQSDDQHHAACHFLDKNGMATWPGVETLDEAMRICQTHKDRRVAELASLANFTPEVELVWEDKINEDGEPFGDCGPMMYYIEATPNRDYVVWHLSMAGGQITQGLVYPDGEIKATERAISAAKAAARELIKSVLK